MTYTREGGEVEFKMSLKLKPPGDERDAPKISFDSNARKWNASPNHYHEPIDLAWHGHMIVYNMVRYKVAEVNTSCSKRPILCSRVGGGQGLKVPPALLRKMLAGENATGSLDVD